MKVATTNKENKLQTVAFDGSGETGSIVLFKTTAGNTVGNV